MRQMQEVLPGERLQHVTGAGAGAVDEDMLMDCLPSGDIQRSVVVGLRS